MTEESPFGEWKKWLNEHTASVFPAASVSFHHVNTHNNRMDSHTRLYAISYPTVMSLSWPMSNNMSNNNDEQQLLSAKNQQRDAEMSRVNPVNLREAAHLR